MKTRILLIIFILPAFIQVNAQDRKFNFGLKIAPAISWLNSNSEHISSDGASVRLNWGFIGVYNFSENFGLVSGFNVNSLGGKLKSNLGGDDPVIHTVNAITNAGEKRSYSEIQIPAIFQMKSNDIAGFKIFFQIGLAGGVLVSAKQDDKVDVYSETSLFNASWIVASGIDIPVKGDIDLIGQLKYNGGLLNVGKGDFSGVKASFVELGLGILF